MGVKLSPLTPTLSHGGERENEVKSDYIKPASQKVINAPRVGRPNQ